MMHLHNLHGYLTYAGLPVQSVRQVNADPMQVDVVWSRSLTANEQAKAQGMAASCGCQLLIPQTKSERSVVAFASAKPPQVAEIPESILLTGGIGDAFALESFFSQEMRDRLRTIYYACPAGPVIASLFQTLPNYPRLAHHEIIQVHKTYYTKAEVEEDYGKIPAVDFSISKVFSDLKEYTGSSFITYSPEAVSKPAEPYVIVCPSSSWGKWPGRSFDAKDWEVCIAHLEASKRLGLVFPGLAEKTPKHSLLLEAPPSSICASLALFKGACGYLGIDTCWSVLAAKLWSCVSVKATQSGGAVDWKHIYYAPRKDFSFVHSSLLPPPRGL